MPEFPTKEADILALLNQMIAGRQAHPADFPYWTGPTLEMRRSNYIAAKNSRTNAYAAAQLATREKLAALKSLEEVMKNRLKQAEVGVAGDPEKLAYIGWGPKAQSQPVEAPGQPNNLHPVAEGQGILWLVWDSPANGGPVRNYIIERREQPAGGGEFKRWSLAGSAMNNEINLDDQPRGVQMEYRVKAINTGGKSAPSNTVAVVL